MYKLIIIPFFDWIKNKNYKSEQNTTFIELKRLGLKVLSAKNTYNLLIKLDSELDDQQFKLLLSELNKINYTSNTNSVFYFYLPIVSHILFFKPESERKILHHIIGPNIANGESDSISIIHLIQGAMRYKLSENKNYLTSESQYWIVNELPKLKNEIEREIIKYFNDKMT